MPILLLVPGIQDLRTQNAELLSFFFMSTSPETLKTFFLKLTFYQIQAHALEPQLESHMGIYQLSPWTEIVRKKPFREKVELSS